MCITICSACRAEHIPTTAGIPDLLQMLVQLTQSRLAQRLMFINELQATVLEVRSVVLHQLFAQSPSLEHLSCTRTSCHPMLQPCSDQQWQAPPQSPAACVGKPSAPAC